MQWTHDDGSDMMGLLTQLVLAGFAVGADLLFDQKCTNENSNCQAEANSSQDEAEKGQKRNDTPPRYHAVADSACVAYAISHEILTTLVPTHARSLLAELGKFRLALLRNRAERRRTEPDGEQ